MSHIEKEELYKSKASTVYKITDRLTGKVTCSKKLSTPIQLSLAKLEREIQILREVQNYKCCVKILDSKSEQKGTDYIITIIMEYCEGGTLRKELERRSKLNATYTPREMIDYIIEFVDLFSMLQEKSISHRDIKPDNILLSQGKLKIGDFGSSRFTQDVVDFTIAGSPLYLSPQLREGYNQFLARTGGIQIVHCPYKSDVYSLGLVFASMASLFLINQEFTDLSRLENLLSELLLKIRCIPIRQIISLMLSIRSDERPDFIQLKDIIRGVLIGICKVCLQPGAHFQCSKCNFYHHTTCLASEGCTYCAPVEVSICTECHKSPGEKSEFCSHVLCKGCKIKQTRCQFCLGFTLFDKPVEGFVQLPESYKCIRCHENIRLSECKKFYNCDNCNTQYCSYCKNLAHCGESCVKNFKISKIYCKYGHLCTKDRESIFFICDECSFRCVVCFGKTTNDHLSCAGLYQKIN